MIKLDSDALQAAVTRGDFSSAIVQFQNESKNLSKQLLVVKHLFSNNSLKIKCDFIWFSEALENIIKNCIEINPDDVIDIDSKEDNFQVKILIHDHGPGFETKDLNHLFERFYTTKNSQGFGIGLALAKEIIKGHYGTIEAKNDQGALFIITIPKIMVKKKC